jgi:NAD(P)-dependent dehydrogenase (short-subunit alcohol dehydrogenase family)
MRGKTIVITGGTSGIGEVAAVALAKMGARIVLVARDKSRGDATLARLRDNAPSIAHSVYFADLLRLAEMKRVAAEIADRERRIDVLINNAGALFAKRRLTEDGLERTFALNHMQAAFSLSSRPHHQYGFRRAPRRLIGFRRSPISKELRRKESLWSVEAMQYPIHA